MSKKKFLIIIPITLIILTFLYYLEYDRNLKADLRTFLIDSGIIEKPIRPYSEANNHPFVYRAIFNDVTKINPLAEETSQNLPNTLIIPPGKYYYFNQTYDLTEEGLYRFVHPLVENQQRIVYEQNVDALLSSVAWIYTHGNSDTGKSIDELNEKALESKIFGICATISNWIQYVLSDKNVQSRIVQTITLDEWNTYDNGHTLIEVYRDDYGKWVVYDLDNNAYFTADGQPLSLYEFVNHVKTNDYEIIFIADDTELDASDFKANNDYEYAFLSESISANEDTLRKWYKRSIQVPLILVNDDVFYTVDSENEKERVEQFAKYYTFLEKDEFVKRFYQ